MTAERKPSEIADAISWIEGVRASMDHACTLSAQHGFTDNLAKSHVHRCDTILAALRSAAPPRGEPTDQAESGEYIRGYKDGLRTMLAVADESPAPSAGRDAEDAERPWMRWRGDYDKQFYDVLIAPCSIVLHCWPNAGVMAAVDGTGRRWKPADLLAVRVSQFQEWPEHVIEDWSEVGNAAEREGSRG